MIGGNTSFGSGEWDRTVWDGLIPIDMQRARRAADSESPSPRSGGIPPQSIDHPIWRIVDDPERNREVLERMPMFDGSNLTDRLKPAATVLGLSDRSLNRPTSRGRNWRQGRFRPERQRRENPDGTSAIPCLLVPELRPRANVCHVDRHDRGLGPRIREEAGGRVTTATSASSGETSSTGSPRIGRRQPPAPGRDRQGLLPPGPADRGDGAGIRSGAGGDRCLPRARSPASSERKRVPAVRRAETDLVPQLGDRVYRGKLTSPPLDMLMDNPGTTVHELLLDVAAFDGEAVEARVERRRSDHRQSGRVPRSASRLGPARRAGPFDERPRDPQFAGTRRCARRRWRPAVIEVVNRSPLWDRPVLWLILLGVLSAEWVLRRFKGLA